VCCNVLIIRPLQQTVNHFLPAAAVLEIPRTGQGQCPVDDLDRVLKVPEVVFVDCVTAKEESRLWWKLVSGQVSEVDDLLAKCSKNLQ